MKTEAEIKQRIEYLERQLTEITFMVMESSINAEIYVLKWVLNEKK